MKFLFHTNKIIKWQQNGPPFTMAARECCYNVYSDKLDHQRASESFWSKYFHVWICEDPFQESQRKTLVFLLLEFLQNLTLTCQALEKVSYIVGRSSDPSPQRGPVVPRLPCVRHPLIMLAFPSTFSATKSDLDKLKERKKKKEKRKRVDLEVNVSFQRKALVLGAVVTTCWVSALQSLVGKDIGTLRVFEQLLFSCFFFKQLFLLHFIYIYIIDIGLFMHSNKLYFPSFGGFLRQYFYNLYTLGLPLHSNNLYFPVFWGS